VFVTAQFPVVFKLRIPVKYLKKGIFTFLSSRKGPGRVIVKSPGWWSGYGCGRQYEIMTVQDDFWPCKKERIAGKAPFWFYVHGDGFLLLFLKIRSMVLSVLFLFFPDRGFVHDIQQRREKRYPVSQDSILGLIGYFRAWRYDVRVYQCRDQEFLRH
jgi:hypothetical protein